ncbi:MAG: polyphosphate polymerase domain-containing protein [Alphaproteobacteria bacterium]|nr:polyphosphate polymerase domain-containing protein [Alphaproteobacteria bacterium]
MSDYRYEMKFVLDESRLSQAVSWLYSTTGAREAHPKRTVNSIYFDDPGYSAVRDNLAGISQRRKIRLRWYHDDKKENINSVHLEVKYRDGRLGGKDRFDTHGLEKELLDLKYGDLFQRVHSSLGGDRSFLADDYFFPTLHVSYEREYYEGLDGVRVTFDRSVQFSSPLPHMKLSESQVISYPQSVMEVKFPAERRSAVVQSLRALNLTPKRHSKYLVGLAAFGYATYY